MKLVAVLAALAIASCGGDDDDGDGTLEPLPIDGGTTGPTTVAGSVTPSTERDRPGSGSTTTAAAPIGDWDGALFDAGTIAAVADAAGYRTIGFDRYSFADPVRGVIDAGGFEAEPVVAWWRESPFSNVRVQLRTFVLDPDVEVLVLDESDRTRACADPPPPTALVPSWDPADTDVLEDPAIATSTATLTYSATGQVTKIRFTKGC